MKHHKKIFEKKSFFRWISLGGIFFLLIFQFLSLFSTYENISAIIYRAIDEALTETVGNYRDFELRKNKNPIQITLNPLKKKEKEKKKDATTISVEKNYEDSVLLTSINWIVSMFPY